MKVNDPEARKQEGSTQLQLEEQPCVSYQRVVFSIKCWEREYEAGFLHRPLLFFSGLFHTMTFLLWVIPGRNQLRGRPRTDCSCSAGLCLVSLTLSKADHAIPSTPPAGQESTTSSVSIQQPVLSWLKLFTCHCYNCWDYVIVDAFCMRRSEPGWMAVFKHPWSRVFRRLLGNQRVV